MKKNVLLTAGGLTLVAIGLIALPSPSASVHDQDESSSALQKKLDKVAQRQEKLYDKEIKRALEAAKPTLAQDEATIEELQRVLPEEGEWEVLPEVQELQQVVPEEETGQVSVLVDGEGPSWLGVETHEVTSDNAKELKLPAERGVVVGRVTPDSPAAKAGLKEKDVITDVNGQRIEGAAQFRRMIHEIPAGRAAQLGIWRDGRAQNLSVTLGKAEENHHSWMNAAPGAFAFTMPKVEIPEMPPMDLGGHVMMFPGAHARLGIDAEDIGGQLGSYFGAPDGDGILVRSVNSGSPAEKAGLKAGDVITTLNGERIRTVGELREKLSAKPDEKQVKLGMLRNKSEVTLTVELPERSSKVHRKTIARRTYI